MLTSNNSKIYYKYRNFDNLDYILDIFNNNCLFASSFQKLNDPMDSFFSHYNADTKILEDLKNEKLKQNILSLSKSSDNILMWTHYADEHRGFVLGVEIDDENSFCPQKIEYKAELPELEEDFQLKDANTIQGFINKILTTKLTPWEYEEEVRVLSKNNKVNIKIKKIIFGYKTSNNYKKMIKNYFSEEEQDNIEFITMKLDDLNTKFKLVKV